MLQTNDGREERLLEFIKTHPEKDSMKGNPSKILNAIDHYSNQKEMLITVGPEKGRVVADIIAEEKPKIFVQLGTHVGYSAILFADCMRKQRPNDTSVHLWALEIEPNFVAIAAELVEMAGLQEIVTVVTGRADESMRKLKADGKLSQIDMLFIDHVEEMFKPDLQVAMEELGLLKVGASILADNILIPGAPEYREYVRGHQGLSSKGVKALIVPGDFPVSAFNVICLFLADICRTSSKLQRSCERQGRIAPSRAYRLGLHSIICTIVILCRSIDTSSRPRNGSKQLYTCVAACLILKLALVYDHTFSLSVIRS
jgi:catechol O-methyltransferase